MLLALLFVSLLSNIVGDILYGPHKRDEVPQCTQWASSGECDENPDYMLKSCVDACSTVKRQDPPYNDATSFYDIVEIDIDGNEVRFEKFRDKIVFVMNVASECGYTKSGYDFLRAMSGWRDKGLELLIYPCNQFGNQEPGSPEEIKRFAEAQGFKGTIISKSFVKGAHTRPSFKWMMDYIGGGATYQPKWNFDAKLMIDTRGRVHNLYAQPTLYQDIARHMRAYLEQEGQDISDLHVEEL